jgi:hypothetical protein
MGIEGFAMADTAIHRIQVGFEEIRTGSHFSKHHEIIE